MSKLHQCRYRRELRFNLKTFEFMEQYLQEKKTLNEHDRNELLANIEASIAIAAERLNPTRDRYGRASSITDVKDALAVTREFVHESAEFHMKKKRGPEKDLGLHGWEYHQGAADVLRQVKIFLTPIDEAWKDSQARQALLKNGSEPG